ncbi:hypothetical protein AB4Y30_01450 [Ornithinibacillus sp. 4-3]|uniref:Uncharacterized protein n=1 Tax=Ornithinibacillus sp. 4-3 TaxID=3231488 RepID=A0AB39HQZ6_9BACI
MKMNGFLKFISISLIFTLLLTSINVSVLSGKVVAAEENKSDNYTEEDVEELAHVLEILFDKGIIYDENGVQKGFDRELVKKELSDTEYSDLISDLEDENLLYDSNEELISNNVPIFSIASKTPREAYLDKCITNELSNAFGLAAAKTIIDAIKNKSFKKAAKALLKAGIKGVGVPVTLGYILTSCLIKTDKKFK